METAETSHPDFWNLKGTALGKERRFEEAIVYFNRAIEIDVNSVKAWYNKALTLKSLQRYSEALDCFSRAARLAPKDADIARKIKELTTLLTVQTPPARRFSSRIEQTDRKFQWVVTLVILGIVALGLWRGNSLSHIPKGQINQINTANISNNAPVIDPILSAPNAQPMQSSHKAVSLPNGTVISRQKSRRGQGKMTVKNGTTQDGIVKMVSITSPRKAYCRVYVQANMTCPRYFSPVVVLVSTGW